MKTAALILAAIIMLASNVSAQTSAFTYQGQLRSNNAPANGNFDLQFSVFAAASGGSALTTPISNPTVEVSNGVFTVLLDFGVGAFSGADRWLEIGVRPTGNVNPYTILAPRQLIAATPYAIRAGTAGTATTVTGPISDAQLSANIARLNTTNTFTGQVTFNNPANTFAGNGSGLSNLNSANLTGPISVQGASAGYQIQGVGHTSESMIAQSVAVNGNYAYIGDYSSRFRVYNISNPASPLSVANVDSGGSGYGVTLIGNYAYLANGGSGLRIYDVSNPANPGSRF